MKNFLRAVVRAAGYEVKARSPVSDPYVAILRAVRHQNCKTLLDVGANAGQFAGAILNRGWAGEVISFEPLSKAHAELTSKAANNPKWTVAPRMALGAENGTTEINISANSQSSSLLPMADVLITRAPETHYVGTETVSVRTLNEVVEQRFGVCALKLDVQGYERHVLDGAKNVLSRIPVIWTEMSLQHLYSGEPLFSELSDHLMALGYRCTGLWPGYYDKHSGEMLQVDGLFVR